MVLETAHATLKDDQGFTHDVFISYSRKNRDWVVGELLPRLEQAGLKAYIDERDFAIGVPSIVNIERAVDCCRHTLVVLTPAWVLSDWTNFESYLVAGQDVAARKQRMLPLLLEACDLPRRIKMLTYADFTDAARRDTEFLRLVRGLTRSESTQEIFPFINEQITESAREGTDAFAELVRKPEVQAAAARWKTVFATAREQMEMLSNYKALHDRLHDFEIQCHRQIAQELSRFPDDERSVDNLFEYDLMATQIVRDIQETAAKAVVLQNELPWIRMLEQACQKLHESIETMTNPPLARSCDMMRRILTTQPSNINRRLNEAAARLQLPNLFAAMKEVRDQLAHIDEYKDLLIRLDSGIEALEGMNRALTDLVQVHDQWQRADIELRQMEVEIDSDAGDLSYSWQLVRDNVQPLLVKSVDQWAEDLRIRVTDLQSAMDSGERVKIRRSFRLLRRQALERFYATDRALLTLCEDMRKVGEPLTSVWEIIS